MVNITFDSGMSSSSFLLFLSLQTLYRIEFYRHLTRWHPSGLQPRWPRMDHCSHRSRVDHDSRRRLLLLRFIAAEERNEPDLSEYDDVGGC